MSWGESFVGTLLVAFAISLPEAVVTVATLPAMMMTGAAIAGILYRPRTRRFRTIGWAGMALFVIYMLNSYVQYLYGTS